MWFKSGFRTNFKSIPKPVLKLILGLQHVLNIKFVCKSVSNQSTKYLIQFSLRICFYGLLLSGFLFKGNKEKEFKTNFFNPYKTGIFNQRKLEAL